MKQFCNMCIFNSRTVWLKHRINASIWCHISTFDVHGQSNHASASYFGEKAHLEVACNNLMFISSCKFLT